MAQLRKPGQGLDQIGAPPQQPNQMASPAQGGAKPRQAGAPMAPSVPPPPAGQPFEPLPSHPPLDFITPNQVMGQMGEGDDHLARLMQMVNGGNLG